jgi:hypothetical protein
MSVPRWKSLLAAVVLALSCAACSARSVRAGPPVVLEPPPGVAGVVLCADASGGLGEMSTALKKVVGEDHTPLYVEQVEWSHGTCRFLSDHLHWSNIQEKGEAMAGRAQALLAQCPGRRIYFVGHSAGCAVTLVAAAAMPPGSVERIVLVAPSVAAKYDVRPALQSSVQGIDVFCSKRDWWILGLGMALSGTTDRSYPPVAGRVGFQKFISCPADEALYANLHQHFWEPCLAWTGHKGGHYGGDSPGFVRVYILPLLHPAQHDHPAPAVQAAQ